MMATLTQTIAHTNYFRNKFNIIKFYIDHLINEFNV